MKPTCAFQSICIQKHIATADKIGKNYRSDAMHAFLAMIYKTTDVLLSVASQLMRSLNDMFESKKEYIYVVTHSYKEIRCFSFFESLTFTLLSQFVRRDIYLSKIILKQMFKTCFLTSSSNI